MYRRTIHFWRTNGRYPETISEARRAAWTAAWHDQTWLDRAGKNKTNRSSEPTIPVHQGTDPTSWNLYLHTHRCSDGSLVDERSRLVNPSSEEVNNMFKHVVGGRKKGRMYCCGSMASTIYPHEMAPRPRRGGSRSSHDSGRTLEEFEQQNRVIEYLREYLQASNRRGDEMEKKNEMLESRLAYMEYQICRLVSGLPPVALVHLHTQSYDWVLHDLGASSIGRSIARSSRHDPHANGSSRDDRFAVFSSRPDLRDKRLRASSSYHCTSSQARIYSQ